jgi:oxygen-independent coproporphyrinogen-3 oxidase
MLVNPLVSKYNVPGPRYTSYPTVPFWKNSSLTENEWKIELVKSDTKTIALYIHLPFCESLCTFCGCHKRITRNHQVETPYIDAVIKEWEVYKEVINVDFQLNELHLGGGTPTFFATKELERLIQAIKPSVQNENCEMSFEAHPSSTTPLHLQVLFDLGFRRVSFGIQDYDLKVQKAIHRIQDFDTVKNVHELAKKIGYSSINHDLIYGLPFQTMAGFLATLEQTMKLMPERIALYSYAHVPWIKGTGQRGYSELDLPQEQEKMQLYEMATAYLISKGYISIGMDHFALPNDGLSLAFHTNKLHRNFMGYTTKSSATMIGLGMSAISDSWGAFAQNEKNVEAYLAKVNKNELPVFKGHILDENELFTRKQILDLMCHYRTELPKAQTYWMEIRERLEPMIQDELVKIDGEIVVVSLKGRSFIRNICMAFDYKLHNFEIGNHLFSKTI